MTEGDSQQALQALGRLDEVTRRLRRECPWDREQDERSIVPHTVEEAYELADAAHQRDDAKLRDELGDVLFQVHFLSLLLEERDAGDLAAVAAGATDKLVRRHPHVFGEVQVAGADDVLSNWDAIKRSEPGRPRGLFADVPETLPALLQARKLQRRAAGDGFDFADVQTALSSLREELAELQSAIDAVPEPAAQSAGEAPTEPVGEPVPRAGETARPQAFHELGDALFALVSVARKLRLDPELALRAASGRFAARVRAAADRAAAAGEQWEHLSVQRQLEHYDAARAPDAPASPTTAPNAARAPDAPASPTAAPRS